MSGHIPSQTKTRKDPLKQAIERREDIVAVARAYLERGWKPVPIPSDRKSPKQPEWQLEETTLDNVRSKFHLWDGNIGVQFGPVSNGLADVDLDCDEAREL